MKNKKTLLICMSAIFLLWLSGCSNVLSNGQGDDDDNNQKNIDYTKYNLGALPEPQAAIERSGFYQPPLENMASIPSSFDLSDKMPPVGDQGTQNSCVGWAVAYALKTSQEGREENWDITVRNHQFSPAWIYNQINSGQDKGSYVSEALQLIVDKGCDTLAGFPYNQKDYTTQPDIMSLARAKAYKAASWTYLNHDVENLKSLIAAGNPIVFRVDIYPDFYNIGSGDDIYDSNAGPRLGGHAMCLVGYDDAKRAFKFINSWGPGWGVNGYGWLSYDLVANNGAVRFMSYWLEDKENTDEPFYQVRYSTQPDTNRLFANFGLDRNEDIFTGDFNGDGRDDAIVRNRAARSQGVYFSNADGTFTEKTFFADPAQPQNRIFANFGLDGNEDIFIGDFNGDGKDDAIVRNGVIRYQGVYFSNGDGTFTEQSFFTNPAEPHNRIFAGFGLDGNEDIYIGDFNGDRQDDAIVRNREVRYQGVYFSNGDGTFTEQTFFTDPAQPQNRIFANFGLDRNEDIFIGDFNGDGRSDAVVRNREIRYQGVYFSNGDGTFAEQTFFTNPAEPQNRIFSNFGLDRNEDIFIGDFNGDGRADAVLRNREIRYQGLYFANTDGRTFNQIRFSTDPGVYMLLPGFGLDGNEDIFTGDFNGDGYTDVIARNKVIRYQGIYFAKPVAQ